jgi:hypothetical protein
MAEQTGAEFAATLAATVTAQAGDGYRCWSTDLLTGRPLSHDLPLAVDSYTYGAINTYGTMSATISLDTPEDPLLTLAERRTCVWISHRDRVVWGGIVWDTDPDIPGRTLRVGAQTWSSYWEHVLIRQTLVYRGTEQLDIFRALITYAQAKAGANIGVTVDPRISGATITRLYGPGAGDGARPDKPVSEALKELAETASGFEFCDDWRDDGTTHNPSKVIRIGYPTLGSSNTPGLMWEYPGTILNYTWPKAGKGSPNVLYAVGAGDGAAALVESATNTPELTFGYPLLESSTGGDHKEIVTKASLRAHATADLAAMTAARLAPTFTVRADVDPLPGDYTAGDRIRCRLTSAYHRPQRDGSPGYDGYFRITAVNVKPARADQDGSVTIATVPDGLA